MQERGITSKSRVTNLKHFTAVNLGIQERLEEEVVE